jgi:hypothetical protein
MPLTPEEREEIKAELRREQEEAALTPEQKAEKEERESFMNDLADRVAARLKPGGKEGEKEGDPPPPEKKPKGGHPMERKLFGRKTAE